MCGIAGIVGRADHRPDGDLLRRMAERIVHRGPDEDGFFVANGIGLAFRRLRIVDLETGSQPMTNEDGNVRVVFNGEIYNHRELREWLEGRGHRFTSRSDTEVLVHLWEELGPDLVHRLNGMFAFAIWDANQRSLFLARDRVGIKPLLFAETKDGLVFGSEMGSILEAEGVDDRLDEVAVHQHLAWGAVAAPRTILAGVRRLEPGHGLLWRDGGFEVERYWHPLDADVERPRDFRAAAKRLRELLEDSIRLRRLADVPLGAFLSGGVDSTAIAGLLAAHGGDVSTFSIGFADDPVFDETPWARDAAAFHRTRHHERQLDASAIRDVLPHVLDSLDEPFGSSSILPAFVVSRETRQELTVALSGDGADELFAGYEKYKGEAYRRSWQKVPSPLRRHVAEPILRSLPASRDSRLGEFGRKAHRFLDGIHGDPAERHDRWMRFAPADEICTLLGTPFSNPTLDLVREVQSDWDARGGDDSLNRTLFTDLRLALPTDMLRKVDTASMLNSLEVRVPFLDHRVVEFALRLPGEWKMRGTERKLVLREAVRDLLPPSVRRRPKAGFEVPFGEWLKTSLADVFWDTVSGDGDIPLDPTTIRRWYDEHRSGKAERAKVLWAVFTLRWWERRRAARTATTRTAGVTG
ncbi:MAG: asparagine synthase (glutamine-hydrolyzing) [Gemmatimonadetes bacterium]|nr:asparagine synthase (glutamine-hydrolyzing) [Gemmatimonadota bacterium]